MTSTMAAALGRIPELDMDHVADAMDLASSDPEEAAAELRYFTGLSAEDAEAIIGEQRLLAVQ
jgi:hypothetical protein